MKCDRCGRENPDHLKFCQDCGNRLIASASRMVEPTPPRGVALVPSAPALESAEESAGHIRSRPPAPDFDFSPRSGGASHLSSCTQCGAQNPAENRFCSECGTGLDSGAHAQRSAALLGAPVVGIAPPPAAAPDRIVCSRCRGSNAAAMSFCQYCGARLGVAADEEAPVRERARTNPESPLALGVPPIAAPAPVPAPAPAPTDVGPSDAAAAIRPPLPGTPPPPSRKPATPAAAAPVAAAAPHPTSPSVPPLGTAAQAGSAPAPAPAATTGRFLPAQLPTAPARLVVIAQDGSPGRDYPLVAEHTDIGRDEGNVLLPNDPYVSPRHARIQRRAGRYFVQDLDSVNGIFVRLRAVAKLEHGDLVLMGLEVLRFEVVSAADKGYGPATDRDTQVFGSPAAPRYARLTQRTVEGVARDTYFLTRDETVIGRESGDIVFTGDPFMSRRHSAVTRQPTDNTFSIRDLGSSNGTYLRIRGEHEIVDGDHIRIGQHLFRLEVAPSGQA